MGSDNHKSQAHGDVLNLLQAKVERLTKLLVDKPGNHELYKERGLLYGQLADPVAAINDFSMLFVK